MVHKCFVTTLDLLVMGSQCMEDNPSSSIDYWAHGCRMILTFSWMSQWQAYHPPLHSAVPHSSSLQQGKAVQEQHLMALSLGCQLSQAQGHPLVLLGQASPQGLGWHPPGRPQGPLLLATLLHPLSWLPHPCQASGPGHSLSTQEQACCCPADTRSNDIILQEDIYFAAI